MLDVSSFVKPIQLLVPLTRTSTASGTAVDISKYEGIASAVISLGAALTTTETCIVTIETSDTSGGTFTVVATAPTLTGTSDNTVIDLPVDLRSAKKWIRATATIAGTTPSFDIGVLLLVTQTQSLPV